MERRKFLKYAAATAVTPFFFQGQWISAWANKSVTDLLLTYNSSRKLVIVQLDGGNDGLNMLIPISQYDNLANARKNILVDQSKILKLNDETGLHPSMPELTNLYSEGKVLFVQGVGYPDPNLSHFRSKDILMSASDAKTVISSGWAGRMFSKQYPNFPNGYPNASQPHPIALTIGSTSSPICQGDLANYSTVLRSLSATYSSNTPTITYPETPFGNELKFVTNVMEQTESYLGVIKSAAASAKNLSALYPASGTNSLADQLKLVANLIAGGLQTQIYVVSLGGWDLHSGQVTSETDKLTGGHPTLLSKLSKAIAAFQDDLKLMGRADEVIGFVFTEFGRRIKSNDSLGTDHGTSWPAIVFGTKVNAGIIGKNPTIPAIVTKSDNLAMQYDFRSIYTGIYKQWFGLETTDVNQLLGASFPEMQVISKATVTPNEPSVAKIKLYPNPVSDQATLTFDSKGEMAQILVYSNSGQLVSNLQNATYPTGQQTLQVQFGHLRSGIYHLVLKQKTEQNTVKFVKQ
ncbi:MAG TPA: DUF1501 domain-containing protein [Prolixibacteraceae bacterium]|nr:DUF1501 domain-containing protein [Prolixibacteraceae bacterium]